MIDFGCQVGVKNRCKIDAKRVEKSDAKKVAAKMGQEADLESRTVREVADPGARGGGRGRVNPPFSCRVEGGRVDNTL